MPLQSGQELLHYSLVEKIGEGGMGVVWKAEDTLLGREVALKILPGSFSDDPERLARFEREARVLASLNHPHIAGIYGIHETEGIRFLSMELVHGEDLSVVLERGALPLARALLVARQVAEALEVAHESGVVHRDLKPANVRLSREGNAKVLDFGLAKAHDPAPDGDLTTSPTMTSVGTVAGLILGTAAYMSPEQASGQPTDRRADIWSFGVMLYELLSNKRLFAGETISHTLADVLRAPIVLDDLPPGTPTAIRHLIGRCLERDTMRRLRDIGEARVAIEDAIAELHEEDPVVSAADSVPDPRNRLLWVVTGLALVAVFLFFAFVWSPLGGSRSVETARRFALDAPRRVTYEEGLETVPSISPDGTQVAYSSGPAMRMRIYIRSVQGGSPRPLTDDADPYEFQPRYSPGGESILFLTPDGAYRAPALGGQAIPVALFGDLSSRRASRRSLTTAAAWSPDGKRVFIARFDGELSIESIDGGTAVALGKTTVGGLNSGLHSCSWSPRGDWIACTSGNAAAVAPGPFYGNTAPTAIVLVRASDGEQRIVVDPVTANQSPVWSPDGRYLLYVSNRQGPYDIYSVEIAADGSVVGDPVRVSTGLQARSIALSADGTRMIYETYSAKANLLSLPIPVSSVPVDASDAEALTTANQVIESMLVSHDGRFVVYDSNLPGNYDIYRISVDGGVPEQLTDHTADDFAGSLSPDGEQLAYHSFRSGGRHVFVQRLRGDSPQNLTESLSWGRVPAWSPVPGRLALLGGANQKGRGLFLVTRSTDGRWSEPDLLLAGAGRFDWLPDGERIACSRNGGIEVVSIESRDTRVVYQPVAPDDPRPEGVRTSDHGRTIYFKSHDEAGRASIWSIPIEGGRPTLLVRFTDDERPSIREDFDASAGRFFFTTEERESDVWVADLVRQ